MMDNPAAPPRAVDDGDTSAVIADLRASIRAGDARAVAAFWQAMRERGTPIIEPVADAPDSVLVTFVYRSETAQHVLVLKGLGDPRSTLLARLPGTDVWARSYRLPADARFEYSFAPDFPLTPPPLADLPKLRPHVHADPLNHRRVGLDQSLCVLPNAPPQLWTEPASDVAAGEVQVHRVTSKRLGNQRRIYVYTPPGYEREGGPYPLVVLFDGVDYLSGIPTPTILDNLIAQKRVPPTIALMIDPVDRVGELGLGEAFTEIVAREIVPFVQRRYGATADPSAVVVGGFSAGGLEAVWSAFCYPEVFGNALAQSDARFPRPDGEDVYEWVARQVAAVPRKPIRFHLEDGRVEEANKPLAWAPFQCLRPVLSAKGYRVTVRTFRGGHHTMSWRGRLGDALAELLQSARPQDANPSAPTDDLTIEDLGPSVLAAVVRAAALGGADAALRVFQEMGDSSADLDEPMLSALGLELLYAAGQPRAAVAVLTESTRRFPSSANASNALAEALYVAGDRAGAISLCRKALDLDP
ncbi:MAG: enterochelin esterase, partial [Myxococcales bacterium]|nr:enterochelin esterase [Myxococcales bacterium]